MTNDRRKYTRIPLESLVTFQEISFHKPAEPALLQFKDVSGGGLLIASDHPIELGTLMKLEAKLPGWGKHMRSFQTPAEREMRPFVAIGEVVRLEKLDENSYEIGVKFQNVYPDDWEALIKFIESSAPAE